MPVIEALKDCGKPLSVDTYKPDVMTAALVSGADMINDICGFFSEKSLQAVAAYDCGLCDAYAGRAWHHAKQPAI